MAQEPLFDKEVAKKFFKHAGREFTMKFRTRIFQKLNSNNIKYPKLQYKAWKQTIEVIDSIKVYR